MSAASGVGWLIQATVTGALLKTVESTGGQEVGEFGWVAVPATGCV